MDIDYYAEFSLQGMHPRVTVRNDALGLPVWQMLVRQVPFAEDSSLGTFAHFVRSSGLNDLLFGASVALRL